MHSSILRSVVLALALLRPALAFVPSAGRHGWHRSAPMVASSMQEFDDVVMKTYGRYPITMVEGKGLTLTDSNGKEYLDFVAGIATCILGHGHPGMVKAVTDQINTLHHVSNLYYIPKQGELAVWLVKNSPADKVFFCNSGAESNEAAIKLARKYGHTKLDLEEPVIITAHQSFHGRTLAAITATGQPKYQKDFGPMVPGFEYVTYNDAADLKATVERINSEGKAKKRGVCAIMFEALQGEGGIKPGDPAFFKAARELCDATGALLICDEVQVGMGRSGKMWGFQQLGVEPDVFTSAKALGGGVPIGAMMCKDAANVFGPGDHASTYGGNPLACAAGMAVARAIESEGLLENADQRGEQLRAALKALAAEPELAGVVADVRGWGLLSGIQLSDESGLTAGEVVGKCIEKGLLLVPAGPTVVRFVPPLIVSEAEVDSAVATFKAALEEAVKEKRA